LNATNDMMLGFENLGPLSWANPLNSTALGVIPELEYGRGQSHSPSRP